MSCNHIPLSDSLTIFVCQDPEESWAMQLMIIEVEKQRQREIDLDKEREWEVVQPALEIEHEVISYVAVSDWDAYA